MSPTLLQVRDLATHFSTRAGVAKAVDGVSFMSLRARSSAWSANRVLARA